MNTRVSTQFNTYTASMTDSRTADLEHERQAATQREAALTAELRVLRLEKQNAELQVQLAAQRKAEAGKSGNMIPNLVGNHY